MIIPPSPIFIDDDEDEDEYEAPCDKYGVCDPEVCEMAEFCWGDGYED